MALSSQSYKGPEGVKIDNSNTMGLFQDARKFMNKFFKIGRRNGESSELEKIGKQFKNHFNDLSDTLEAPSLPSLPSFEFGRRESGGRNTAAFSLPLVFVTVLVASLAVNHDVIEYVRGEEQDLGIHNYISYVLFKVLLQLLKLAE